MHMQNEDGLVSHHVQKINIKWSNDLSTKLEAIKLLEENLGENITVLI